MELEENAISLVLTEEAFDVWYGACLEVQNGLPITFEERALVRAETVVNDELAIRMVVYGYRLDPELAFESGNVSVVGSFELVDRHRTGFGDSVKGFDVLDVCDADDEIPTHVYLSYTRDVAGELSVVNVEVEVGIGGSAVAAESGTECTVY